MGGAVDILNLDGEQVYFKRAMQHPTGIDDASGLPTFEPIDTSFVLAEGRKEALLGRVWLGPSEPPYGVRRRGRCRWVTSTASARGVQDKELARQRRQRLPSE